MKFYFNFGHFDFGGYFCWHFISVVITWRKYLLKQIISDPILSDTRPSFWCISFGSNHGGRHFSGLILPIFSAASRILLCAVSNQPLLEIFLWIWPDWFFWLSASSKSHINPTDFPSLNFKAEFWCNSVSVKTFLWMFGLIYLIGGHFPFVQPVHWLRLW